MGRDILVNLSQRKGANAFTESFTANIPVVDPYEFYRSDSTQTRLMFVTEQTQLNASIPFNYVDPSAWPSVKLAGGIIGQKPDGGTFILTDVGTAFPTTAIAYNASAATVQAALRAIGGGSFGSCVVTGDAGGPYLVDRVTLGANAGLSGDATALSPDGSTVVIETAQEGSAFLSEKIQVTLAKALPILKTTGWSALPAALVTPAVVQAGSGTANKTFSLNWNADAYGGAVVMSFTGTTVTGTVGPIAYNATASDVAAAFALHMDVGTNGVVVVQTGPGSYTITCVSTATKNSNVPALANGSNTLLVPVGLTAIVNVDSYLAGVILGTADSVAITLEVEIMQASGERQTFQMPATLLKDLILNTPGQTTGSENFVTTGDMSGRSTVRAATTANITISTALNPGDTLDGVSLSDGDTVLVKNQSTASQNGVYVVGATPTRSVFFETFAEHPGALIIVQEGTENADTRWLCISNQGGTIGSSSITFAKANAASAGIAYISAAGLDATARVGDPERPYLTMQAAYDAGATVLIFGVGTFAGLTLTANADLWIVGYGAWSNYGGGGAKTIITQIDCGTHELILYDVHGFSCQIDEIVAQGAAGAAGAAGMPGATGSAGPTIRLRRVAATSVNSVAGAGGAGGTGSTNGGAGGAGATIDVQQCFVTYLAGSGGAGGVKSGAGTGGDGGIGPTITVSKQSEIGELFSYGGAGAASGGVGGDGGAITVDASTITTGYSAPAGAGGADGTIAATLSTINAAGAFTTETYRGVVKDGTFIATA
jgi:hypothetical protein